MLLAKIRKIVIVLKKYQINTLFALLTASFAGLHGAQESTLSRGWSSVSNFVDKILKDPATPYIAAPAALYAGIKLSSLPCLQSETSYPLWALRTALYTLPSFIPSEIARYQRESTPEDDQLSENPYKTMLHLSGPTLLQAFSLVALAFSSPSYLQTIQSSIPTYPPLALTHTYSLIKEGINNMRKYTEKIREEESRQKLHNERVKKASTIFTKEIQLQKEFAHLEGLIKHLSEKYTETEANLAKLIVTPKDRQRLQELRAQRLQYSDEWRSLNQKIRELEEDQELKNILQERYDKIPQDQWDKEFDYDFWKTLQKEQDEKDRMKNDLLRYKNLTLSNLIELQKIIENQEQLKNQWEELTKEDAEIIQEYKKLKSRREHKRKHNQRIEELWQEIFENLSQEEEFFSQPSDVPDNDTITEWYQALELNQMVEKRLPIQEQINNVKKSYHKLAKRWHPDKNPGNEAAAGEKFKGIQNASKGLIKEIHRSK